MPQTDEEPSQEFGQNQNEEPAFVGEPTNAGNQQNGEKLSYFKNRYLLAISGSATSNAIDIKAVPHFLRPRVEQNWWAESSPNTEPSSSLSSSANDTGFEEGAEEILYCPDPYVPYEFENTCSVEPSVIGNSPIDIYPILVDDYFMDHKRKIIFGRDHHQYLQKCCVSGHVKINLNRGLHKCEPRPKDIGLSQIEEYLMSKADKMGTNDFKDITKTANVVMRRDGIAKMAVSPYGFSPVQWKFVVEKFNDVLFLSEVCVGKEDLDSVDDYWNRKFAACILSGDGEPHSLTSDDFHATFSVMFPETDTQKELNLFYSAEMDGLDAEGCHIGVKTHHCELFKNKYFSDSAMKWWVQSKLVEVNDLYVGLRKNNGMLYGTENVTLDELDHRCPRWDGNVCLSAVQHILNQVREKYDELVKPGMLMVVQKRRYAKVKFTTVDAEKRIVLTPEFKARFEA